MKRLVVAGVVAGVLSLVACGDEQGQNAPQDDRTGDTIETPTTGGPASTRADGEPTPTTRQ